jgi:hypothetical protein
MQHFVLSGAAGAGAGAGAGVGVGAGAAAGTVFGPVAFPFAAGAGAVCVVAGAFLPFAALVGAGAVGVVARAFPPFAAGAGGTGGNLEILALFDDEAPFDVAPWTIGSVVSFGKLCIRHSNIIQYHQYRHVSSCIIQYQSDFTLLVFISSGSPSWSL